MHSKQQKKTEKNPQLYIDMGPDTGIYYTLLSYHCLPLAKEDCKGPWWSQPINTTQELN